MSIKVIFYIVVLLLAVVGFRYSQQNKKLLKPGDVAPDFVLKGADGELVNKKQFNQQWLVLYFYPKDDTPGCTKEACQFRDDLHHLEKLGAKVVGVSVDDAASHQAFAQKYHLPFPLLADTEGVVTEQYGALAKVGPLRMAKRYTFLISPDGKIAKAYYRVNASKHSQEIIDDLNMLQSSAH